MTVEFPGLERVLSVSIVSFITIFKKTFVTFPAIFVLFYILLPQLQFIDLKPRNWTFLYIINIIAIYIYWRDTIISAIWFHFASLDLKNVCNRYQMIELNCTNTWAKCSETSIE